MIYTIPLQPVPAQQLTCTLSGRRCAFWVRQLSTGLYVDVKVDDQSAIMGAVCFNGLDLIRNPVSPLPGKLFFSDTQGADDPYYDNLGIRFILQYDDGAA